MAHRVESDEETDDEGESVVEGIDEAHEEDFATKEEVEDAFLS